MLIFQMKIIKKLIIAIIANKILYCNYFNNLLILTNVFKSLEFDEINIKTIIFL